MEFRGYGSLKPAYHTDAVEAAVLRGLAGGRWIATEKAHGANFSIWIDAEAMRCARRTAFLESGDVFHGWEAVRDALRDRLQAVFDALRASKGAERIVVYGELCGGLYPHPEVEAVRGARQVQGGIYYAPDVVFYAFDIVYETAEGAWYLDIEAANALFDAHGVFYARPVMEGTLQTLLAAENAFESLIPGWLGLPPIADNIAEGWVIRHLGDQPVDRSRAIFKSKNARFSERVPAALRPRKVIVLPDVADLSDGARAVYTQVLDRLTPARLAAVRSKELETAPVAKIVGLCVRDAIQDLKATAPTAFDGLEKDERKLINRLLMTEAHALARDAGLTPA